MYTDRGQPRGPSEAQMREWQKSRCEFHQRALQVLVENVKSFLKEGTPLEMEALKEGKEADRFLAYEDEEGRVDESQIIYTTKRDLNIEGDRFYQDTQRRAKNFGEVVFYASGRANWMRGPHGDMSRTVPLALKREMIAAEIVQLTKMAQFYRENIAREYRTDGYPHLDAKVKALGMGAWSAYHEIQERANPYISADMQVALDHFDEYQRLRQAFYDVGGEKLHLVGESEFARLLLTRVYDEDYSRYLKHFQEHPEEVVDLQKRNALAVFGGELDQAWTRAHRHGG
jgi:hypothetical protein